MKKLIFLFGLLALSCNIFAQTDTLFLYEREYDSGSFFGKSFFRLLIFKNGDSLKGIYVMTDTHGFLIGKTEGDITNGIFIYPTLSKKNNSVMTYPETPFKLEMSPDKTKLKIYWKYNKKKGDEFNLVPLDNYFYSGISKIRELPNSSSKILLKLDLSTSNVQLLQVGNFEHTDKREEGFWYKVNVNGIVGWTIGGIGPQMRYEKK
jgi:hypothetical protein